MWPASAFLGTLLGLFWAVFGPSLDRPRALWAVWDGVGRPGAILGLCGVLFGTSCSPRGALSGAS
eukprot:5965239-Pyramimonas_sp.AAC.1